MVTRKPVTPAINTAPNNAQATSIPPYPTTPTEGSAKPERQDTGSVYSPDLNASPAFDLIDMHDAKRKLSHEDDDVRSRDSWEDSDDEDAYEERKKIVDGDEHALRPQPLQIRQSQELLRNDISTGQEKRGSLPAALKPGLAHGHIAIDGGKTNALHPDYTEEANKNPWASTKSTAPHYEPYRQKQEEPSLKNRASMWWAQDGSSTMNQPTGPAPTAWSSSPSYPTPAPPTNAPPTNAPPAPPVELPTQKTPVDELSRMSLASWETAERIPVPQQGQAPLPPVVPQQTGGSGSSNPWRQETGNLPEKQAIMPSPHQQFHQSSNPDYGLSSPAAEQQYEPPPGPPPLQQSSTPPQAQYAPPSGPPPGNSSPVAPIQPPRPGPISTQHANASPSSESIPETPQTRIWRQRSEHYSIKHMRWQDNGRLRSTPILTQNANGPCPLLALVNALVLSTPDHESTALLSTLETRETISLGLLLDAVFDELMSGRRSAANNLPDVSELYAFLLALHTGMNVNPRFVPPSPFSDAPPSPGLTGVHPAQRPLIQAGTFEQTQEMKLYATFGIPLIHGWLPAPHEAAFKAFDRSAQSYDAAQTLPFAEPELEHQLNTEGLNGQEQQLYQDIQTIKNFLNSWPTQLTDHGRDVVSNTLKPGKVAILFRNDHFSTVYKEPVGGALMTLVTDAGYASHDEIVWESLVDVNGSASELFSGDFRSVSHKPGDQIAPPRGSSSSFNTPDSRLRYHGRSSSGYQPTSSPISPEGPPPALPGPRPAPSQLLNIANTASQSEHPLSPTEQEDHDLALALQLQEEEEAAQREAEQQARRNEQLSQQFLERESVEGNPPPVPPRRSRRESSHRTNPSSIPISARPSRTERQRADGEEDLPSYEQAASDRPYREDAAVGAGANSGSGQQGNPISAYDALRRQQSAYAATSTSTVNTTGVPLGHQRRRSDTNRIRRRSSQMHASQYGGGAAGHHNAPPYQQAATAGAAGGAPGIRDAEERCVIM